MDQGQCEAKQCNECVRVIDYKCESRCRSKHRYYKS